MLLAGPLHRDRTTALVRRLAGRCAPQPETTPEDEDTLYGEDESSDVVYPQGPHFTRTSEPFLQCRTSRARLDPWSSASLVVK